MKAQRQAAARRWSTIVASAPPAACVCARPLSALDNPVGPPFRRPLETAESLVRRLPPLFCPPSPAAAAVLCSSCRDGVRTSLLLCPWRHPSTSAARCSRSLHMRMFVFEAHSLWRRACFISIVVCVSRAHGRTRCGRAPPLSPPPPLSLPTWAPCEAGASERRVLWPAFPELLRRRPQPCEPWSAQGAPLRAPVHARVPVQPLRRVTQTTSKPQPAACQCCITQRRRHQLTHAHRERPSSSPRWPP